jgi:DNA-binding transcriptional ArsR family regulator
MSPTLRRRSGGPRRNSACVFSALGDGRRLGILRRLAAEGRPLSITQISKGTDISRQAVTKHLDVLAAAGLVRDERRGRERLYELEPAPLEWARHELDAISERWDQAIDRLRVHLER